MSGIADLFLHLIFPAECPLCGKVASSCCVNCAEGLLSPNLPICIQCFGPYPCDKHSDSFPHYYGAAHEGQARKLVHLLKYGHEGAIGFSLGIALSFLLAETRADALVPIPLHMGSPRLFNQSKKIVKGLSCKLGIPLLDCLSWNVRVSPRAPKAAKDRDPLPKNAFKMKYFPRGVKNAIICDDVCTTGATIFKAATALRESGIQVVASLSFTLGQRGAYN